MTFTMDSRETGDKNPLDYEPPEKKLLFFGELCDIENLLSQSMREGLNYENVFLQI